MHMCACAGAAGTFQPLQNHVSQALGVCSKVDHVKPHPTATGTILLGSIEASPEENIPIGVFLAVNSMAALVNTGTNRDH